MSTYGNPRGTGEICNYQKNLSYATSRLQPIIFERKIEKRVRDISQTLPKIEPSSHFTGIPVYIILSDSDGKNYCTYIRQYAVKTLASLENFDQH